MPYSIRWPNKEDWSLIIGTRTEEAKNRQHNWMMGRAYDKHIPMLRGVLVDCINPENNSPRIKGIDVGRFNYGGDYPDWRLWLTLPLPSACEPDNPVIERMLKWTLHSCVLWAAIAAGFDDVDRGAMGDVATHLHQFEVAGYKTAKQCRMVLHSAMITEILPWKVSKPRRVKFKTSDWTPKIGYILDPEQVGRYFDPFQRVKIDEILDVADGRVVIKFIFTESTAANICAIVIATVDELDAILITAALDIDGQNSSP